MTYILDTISTVGEIFGFLWKKKLWWAFPMVIFLLGLGILVAIGQSTPAGPFIYVLF